MLLSEGPLHFECDAYRHSPEQHSSTYGAVWFKIAPLIGGLGTLINTFALRIIETIFTTISTYPNQFFMMSFDRTKLPNVHFKSEEDSNAKDFTLGPYLRSLIFARGSQDSEQKEFGVDFDQIRISGHETEETTDQNKYLDARIVSRTHASLAWKLKEDDEKPRLYLKDLGSTHGTYLRFKGDNEQRKLIPNRDYGITSGDSIIIGRMVEKSGECHLPIIFDVTIGESTKIDNMPLSELKKGDNSRQSPICIDLDDESDIAENDSVGKTAHSLDPDSEDECISQSYHSESEDEIPCDESVSEASIDEDDQELGDQSSDQSYDHESEAQSEEDEDQSTDLTEHSDQDGEVATNKGDQEDVSNELKQSCEDFTGEASEDEFQICDKSSVAVTGSQEPISANSAEVNKQNEDAIEKDDVEKQAEERAQEQEPKADQAENSGVKNGEPILASASHDPETESEKAAVIGVEGEIVSTFATSVKESEKVAEDMPTTIIKSTSEQKEVAAIVQKDAALNITSVQVTNKRKAEEAELDTPQSEQSNGDASTTPKRQNVGFRTGLAAGFFAGVVGTIIGLSSIPLSESM